MSSLLISTLLLLGNYNLNDHDWFSGSITTKKGEVIEGTFAVVHDYETILIKQTKGHRVLPAFKVSSFSFVDDNKNFRRRYKVLEQYRKGRRYYEFYEIVNKGKVELLRKRKSKAAWLLELRKIQASGILTGAEKEVLCEVAGHHYFLFDDEKLISLKRLKENELLEMINDDTHETREYIKVNGLDVRKPWDLLHVVNYTQARQTLISSNDLIID